MILDSLNNIKGFRYLLELQASRAESVVWTNWSDKRLMLQI